MKRSSGNLSFAAALLAAACAAFGAAPSSARPSAGAARFAPAAKNGRPVPMRWTILVTYARD